LHALDGLDIVNPEKVTFMLKLIEGVGLMGVAGEVCRIFQGVSAQNGDGDTL
jgi:hypothetical protein